MICQVKKIQKTEKNSEVGGWVEPQLVFFFSNFVILCVFFVLFSCLLMFKKKKNWLGGWMGGVLTNPSFSQIFGFFST